MRSIRGIPELARVPVLVRAALNVPVENGNVVSNYRLRRAVPTIQFLAKNGARTILISHIGEMGTETLAPVTKALSHLVSNVSFCPITVGEDARKAVRNLSPGNVLVLENLRRNKGEKENSIEFARELASLADVFVQDSFDTCHRRHASIIGVPALLPSYAGVLLEEEILALKEALAPKSPSLAVIGGAKSSTKEALLSRLLDIYTNVFVGGALANDFLKASGQEVGKSLVGDSNNNYFKQILANPKLVLPVDSIWKDERILDHGPKTIALLADLAKESKSILWNGPLGKYEDGFTNATASFARAVANSNAHSIIGGGDTIASIENLGLMHKFSFVSTGGGAMLEFLAKGSLPGIDALG